MSNKRTLTPPPLGSVGVPSGRPVPSEPPALVRPEVHPVVPVMTEERLMALEREAYEAGYGAGERAGRETGKAAAARTLAALSTLRDTLDQLRDTLVREAERDVLHLAVATARAVIGYEVAADHPVVVAGLTAARGHFAPSTAVRIRVNPTDQAPLADCGAALDDLFSGGYELIYEAAVAPGGALVEGDGKVIDVGLQTRFEQAVESLVEALR